MAAISGTPSKEEAWTLDPLGNWSGFVQKTSGTTDLNQSRSVNKANEITDITESSGTAWTTPVYDRNGNMTTVSKPASLSNGYSCTYDAWNRLTLITDGTIVIAQYNYDGLFRRLERQYDANSPASPSGIDHYEHSFYNIFWQTLESRESAAANSQPESLQPTDQYVWSHRHGDACVLRDRNTDADNLCDDERIYICGDVQVNVTLLVSVSAAPLERRIFAPYGDQQLLDSIWVPIASSSYGVPWSFAGRHLDSESLLFNYRMRYRNAAIGGFVSRDVYEYVDGYNLYSYALFSPTRYIDPYGLAVPLDDPGGVLYHPQTGKYSGPGAESLNPRPDPERCKCGTDITAHIKGFAAKVWKAVGKVRNQGKPGENKIQRACGDITSLPQFGYSWDIGDLYDAGQEGKPQSNAFTVEDCGVGKCKGTVTIDGKCYWAAEVNYYLFGVVRNICATYLNATTPKGLDEHPYLTGSRWLITAHRLFKSYRLLTDHTFVVPERRGYGMGVPGRVAWLEAGWHEDISKAETAAVKQCDSCGILDEAGLSGYFGGVTHRIFIQ
jgi:RHS repeat-associated protein